MEVNDFQLWEMRFLNTRETSIYTVNVTREHIGQDDFSLSADRVCTLCFLDQFRLEKILWNTLFTQVNALQCIDTTVLHSPDQYNRFLLMAGVRLYYAG